MGKQSDEDVVVLDVVGPAGAVGRRFREGSEEAEPVFVQPLKEGEEPSLPNAERVQMEHLTGRMYRVKQLAAGDGPAQVANESYRNNFDSIFGTKPRGRQYLN